MALFQINNFSGMLTRRRVGTMNSGMTPIGKGHSIDPFTDPPILTFNEAATNLDVAHSTFTDIVVDGTVVEESGTLYLYSIDRSGKVYKTNTSTDASTVVTNSLGITLKYGGGIRYINPGPHQNLLFIAHDTGAIYMNTDGTNVVTVQNNTTFDVQMTDVSTSNSTIAVPINIAAPLTVGEAITLSGVVGTPPNPLVNGVTYYVIPFDSTHIRLATSAANAIAGTFIPLTTVGVTGPFTFQLSSWIPNVPHPVSEEFFGGLFIGNGPYLVDFAIGSLIISHSSRLNPTFPLGYTINTVEVDGQGRYLRVGATTGTTQDIITQNPTAPTQAPIARTVYWNGIDDSYDSYDPFTQTTTTSSFSFLGIDLSFAQDFWGSAILQSSGGNVDKLSAMKEIKAPNDGSLTATGDLLFFGAPYYVQGIWRAGIFSFGKLDETDQGNSMYPLVAIPPTSNNTVCTAVGMLKLVQNRYLAENGTFETNSKFYVSTYETGGTPAANFYSFNVTPNGGTPNDGVYETQVEEFTMMQQIERLSFYMLPTSAGVHFKVELVDMDGTVPTGASFEYAYSAGTDDTLLAGSLETFDWGNPEVKNFQGMGLRITNLGTVQPRITQIYITTGDVDKGATPDTPQPTTTQ